MNQMCFSQSWQVYNVISKIQYAVSSVEGDTKYI